MTRFYFKKKIILAERARFIIYFHFRHLEEEKFHKFS